MGFPFIHLRVGICVPELTAQTTEVGLALAARVAFDKLENELGPVLLEPVMRFQILTPEEYFGAINQDLVKRRANIDSVAHLHLHCRLEGSVPLAEVFGYTTTLRSISQGRATITLEPVGFSKAPQKVADRFLL